MKYRHLSISELVKGIRETDQALIRAQDMINVLSKPDTLPHAYSGRAALLESTERLMQTLKEDEHELSAELALR